MHAIVETIAPSLYPLRRLLMPDTRLVAVGLAAGIVLAACAASSDDPGRLPDPSGPARVLVERVDTHASEIDDELPERLPGSQAEGIAATYVLGHLQRAGYRTFLDSVPVEDLVSSTNVVALPPAGGNPSVVVVVAYGEEPSGGANGREVGLFLELARALRALEPEHSGEFVALGAESARVAGGRLGSRRLAEMLRAEALDPLVVALSAGPSGADGVIVSGEGADLLLGWAERLGVAASEIEPVAGGLQEVFTRAGFGNLEVSGDPGSVGRLLLPLLESRAS